MTPTPSAAIAIRDGRRAECQAERLSSSSTRTALFEQLFDAHARDLHSFCFRRTGDRSLAEDLTSTVFLEAWRRRDEIELSPATARPWLFGVAINVLRNHKRAMRRYDVALGRITESVRSLGAEPDAGERLEAELTMRRILAAVNRLPRRHQEVFSLYVWSELTYEQIATALNIPVGTVRSRLARARERLRKHAGSTS